MSKRNLIAFLSVATLSALTTFGFTPDNSPRGVRVEQNPVTSEVQTSRVPDVCERQGETMSRMILDPQMRLAFANEGGIANGGVCWWHSRFQRAAWALAEFAPNEAPPSRSHAKSIIHSLAHMSRVVKIPGYSDLRSFTADHADLVQKELNQWQLRDGFTNQAWIRGLGKKSKYRPSKAMKMMNRLYNDFNAQARRGHVSWVKLQMPGVEAHSALVLDMKRDENGNYELKVVDSNFPGSTQTWSFRRGDTYVRSRSYGHMMPFEGYGRDLKKIDSVRGGYCRNRASESTDQPAAEPYEDGEPTSNDSSELNDVPLWEDETSDLPMPEDDLWTGAEPLSSMPR